MECPKHSQADDKSISLHEIETRVETSGHTDQETDIVYEESEAKRIRRKVDLRLLPILSLTYSFSLIDRVNIPSARIAGMDEALGLSIGARYSIVSMIFFIPYVIFQYPANWALQRLGATIWLSTIALFFGVVIIGIGFVDSWTALLGCRILLGMLEAGYYPGCIYLISCWYVRYEIQLRYSAFFLIGLLASGFGGPLALGLTSMDGMDGIEGWKWIFIIEGAITCGLALLGYVLLINFPHDSDKPNWLTRVAFLKPREASIIMSRIQIDRSDAVPDKFTLRTVLDVLKDWKLWSFAAINMLNNIVTYSYNYFLPIILESDLGYSVSRAQVLTFPPYPVAALYMLLTAFICDRVHLRGPFIIGNGLLAILGLSMTAFLKGAAGRYVGVFFGIAAVSANVTTILSYQHNNIVGQTKRAIASALLIGAGAVGGIIATNIFREQDYPTYRPGSYTTIGAQVGIITLVTINMVLFRRYNRKAEREEVVLEGVADFRYTL